MNTFAELYVKNSCWPMLFCIRFMLVSSIKYHSCLNSKFKRFLISSYIWKEQHYQRTHILKKMTHRNTHFRRTQNADIYSRGVKERNVQATFAYSLSRLRWHTGVCERSYIRTQINEIIMRHSLDIHNRIRSIVSVVWYFLKRPDRADNDYRTLA